MLTAIVLLWIAIKLQAPLWIYVLIVFQMVLLTINFILDVINKIQEKKLKKLQNELSSSLRKRGWNEDTINKTVDGIAHGIAHQEEDK